MYHKYFTKYKFNEKTNNLDESFVGIETQLDYKTCREYRHYFWFMFKVMIGFLLSMWSIVIGVGLGTKFESSDYLCGVICCIPLSILIIVVCLIIGMNGYDLQLSPEEENNAYKNNEEYIQLREHNANELCIMQEWRDSHPFEERIRKAIESGNSNDIAEVIKMILGREGD